jgi:hypothetical protein
MLFYTNNGLSRENKFLVTKGGSHLASHSGCPGTIPFEAIPKGVCQKSVFVIGIRVAGSNPETRKSLDYFTLRVRNDENHPNISAGMRGTLSEIRLLTQPQ